MSQWADGARAEAGACTGSVVGVHAVGMGYASVWLSWSGVFGGGGEDCMGWFGGEGGGVHAVGMGYASVWLSWLSIVWVVRTSCESLDCIARCCCSCN